MDATIIYPHQLYKEHRALEKNRPVYLIEEPLMMGEFPIHTQKMMLHRLSIIAYKELLENKGYTVHHYKREDMSDTQAVFLQLHSAGITHVHISDTTDQWLEKRIVQYTSAYDMKTTRYESQLFLLTQKNAADRYVNSKKHMARFYKKLRIDKNILMDQEGPVGGKWSFDQENRKKLPQGHVPPQDMAPIHKDPHVEQAQAWVRALGGIKLYGGTDFWLPYTHAAAAQWLDDFITERFADFGPYEDALSVEHNRLYHSALSALINIGLITPQQVLDAALFVGDSVPINSQEGFVRQILGWREFMRASYEVDGNLMRTKNFFNHDRQLPNSFWDGSTSIDPVDHAITKALRYGYNHHIDRLMVLGNVMLLSEIHPDEVYTWFMAMYVDAYDWVMVPNVYGMSQFADGGSFATKPYIAGANYIKKMSDYKKGEWEETLTGLYWNFIHNKRELFLANHRMSMMPRLWDKMSSDKQQAHIAHAQAFINQ